MNQHVNVIGWKRSFQLDLEEILSCTNCMHYCISDKTKQKQHSPLNAFFVAQERWTQIWKKDGLKL